MNIPIPKLKAILLYFASFTNNRFLGKVKLMKLLYFLDFTHLKKYGSPITYDTYVNLEHGPIPTVILDLVNSADDDIDNSILSDTIKIERYNDKSIHRIIPLRKFTEKDKKYFSPTELETLETVCQRFGNKNTKQIEDASHKEAAWKETDFSETISYSLAAKDKDCLVSKEEIETLMSI